MIIIRLSVSKVETSYFSRNEMKKDLLTFLENLKKFLKALNKMIIIEK